MKAHKINKHLNNFYTNPEKKTFVYIQQKYNKNLIRST